MVDTLDNEFRIYENSSQIPITSYPSYTQFGLVIYCIRGSTHINIHESKHTINPNEVVFIFPGQLVMASDTSPDFLMNSFEISKPLFDEILSGIGIISPHFFFYMQSHYSFPLNNKEINGFMNYFFLISRKVKSSQTIYRREYVIHWLRVLYLDVYNRYKTDIHIDNIEHSSRKEHLTQMFFQLVMRHYKENKEVIFYADKLCITPKYLSTVVKEISGKSAKEWILEYCISEIKSLLKDSSLHIQEIVFKTNFSNQSALGRFFRKHTGMSPSQYRKSKVTKN